MVKVQKTESLLLLKLLCLPLMKAFAFQFMIKGHVRKALNFCKEITLDPFLSYSRFTSSSHQWLPMTSQYLLLSAAQMHYSVTIVICSRHLRIPRYTPHQAKHMIRETTESSHWKIDLYSFNVAPSRKAFTISLPQVEFWQWCKNTRDADSFTFTLPGGALAQWPWAPFCPPPGPFAQEGSLDLC